MSSPTDKRARAEQPEQPRGHGGEAAEEDASISTKRARSVGCQSFLEEAPMQSANAAAAKAVEEPAPMQLEDAAETIVAPGMSAPLPSPAPAPAPGAVEGPDLTPFGPLPDELVQRILVFAARSDDLPALRPPCCWPELAGGGDCERDEPEAVPRRLRLLRGVSRRFRMLVEDPGAWERVALQLGVANCRQERVLDGCSWPASAAARLGTRRLRVETFDLYPQRLARLGELFPKVTHIDVVWDGGRDNSIANLALFPNLRSVAFRVKSPAKFDTADDDFRRSLPVLASPAWRSPAVDPATQQARGLRQLDLSNIPLGLEHFVAVDLPALAPSLEALFVDVISESAAPVLSKVAALTGLKRLGVGFWREVDEGVQPEKKIWPACGRYESGFLARLTAMEALDVGCEFVSIDFLRQMPKLSALSLKLHAEAVAAPLASRASTLKSLRLRQGHANLSEHLFALPSLEALELRLPSDAFWTLAEKSLGGWTSLRRVELRSSTSPLIPLEHGVLMRLATEVPSLRKLVSWSPLPDANQLLAARGLDERTEAAAFDLVLKGEGDAHSYPDDRAALQLLFPRVRLLVDVNDGEDEEEEDEEEEDQADVETVTDGSASESESGGEEDDDGYDDVEGEVVDMEDDEDEAPAAAAAA
eukprot:tig00021036_g17280.t1